MVETDAWHRCGTLGQEGRSGECGGVGKCFDGFGRGVESGRYMSDRGFGRGRGAGRGLADIVFLAGIAGMVKVLRVEVWMGRQGSAEVWVLAFCRGGGFSGGFAGVG